ncbi:MAG TPA: DUF308 domain-containing protein [Steroidobacteraceae bacterium]|nr:DUF308 domain-containing protein [Steroidobacteraceae bacterium]
MIVLGVLAVAAPVLATIAVDIYVGWLFLISGVIGLVAMFSARGVPGFDLVPLKRRQHRPMAYWLAWEEPRAVGDLVHCSFASVGFHRCRLLRTGLFRSALIDGGEMSVWVTNCLADECRARQVHPPVSGRRSESGSG